MRLRLQIASGLRLDALDLKSFNRHGLTFLSVLLLFLIPHTTADAQKRRRAPTGGRVAIVVDERLSALAAASARRRSCAESEREEGLRET